MSSFKFYSSVAVIGLLLGEASEANPLYDLLRSSPPAISKRVAKGDTVLRTITNHQDIVGGSARSKRPDSQVKVVAIDGSFDPEAKAISSAVTESYLAEVSSMSPLQRADNKVDAALSNHSNHVTGIIAGKNGISPNAKVRPFDTEGYAQKNKKTSTEAIVAACDQAIKSKAQFVNISMRMQDLEKRDQAISQEVRNAFLKLKNHGIVVFKSAGNDGEFLGETAYTRSLVQLAEEMKGHFRFVVNTDYRVSETINNSSNTAGLGKKFTISAPGTRIASDGPNGFEAITGTSIASPIATGVAAKVKAQYPNFSSREVADILFESARNKRYGYWFTNEGYKLDERLYGQGVVNLKSALQLAELKTDKSFTGKAKLLLYKASGIAQDVAHVTSNVAKVVGQKVIESTKAAAPVIQKAASSFFKSVSSWFRS